MIFLPMVGRELRVSSRATATYWLRVTGATALLAAGVIFWVAKGVSYGASWEWFMAMHLTLFWTIWILVPVMTADCISRERRDGTLGLLFLTPLKAWDIVMAKGFVHGLRAASLCVAGIPVLVLPFLTGGVGWTLALSSVLINFSALCWALGAGVLASSRARTFTRSVVGAAAMAAVFFLIMVILQGATMAAVWLAVVPRTASELPSEWTELIMEILKAGFMSFVDLGEIVRFISSPAGASNVQLAWLYAVCGIALISTLALAAIAGWAAFNVRGNWQDKPRSALQTRLEKEFCTPTYGARLFRGWMRRLLERNPIGWLERRTWQARTVSWAWLAVITSLYSVMLGSTRPDRDMFQVWQWIIAGLFCVSLTMSAAGSFRRERESGVMELLLITPLTIGQIINGRSRGIWSQFLPSLLLFVVVQFHLVSIARWFPPNSHASMDGALLLWLLGSTTLTLPVIGLYFSLRCRLLITAVVAALVVGVGLPAVAAMVMGWLSFVGANLPGYFGCVILVAMAVIVRALADQREMRPLLIIMGVAWLVMLSVAVVMLRLDDDLSIRWSTFAAGEQVPLVMAALLCALLQTTCALWLGLKLHQNLENRRFTLPQ